MARLGRMGAVNLADTAKTFVAQVTESGEFDLQACNRNADSTRVKVFVGESYAAASEPLSDIIVPKGVSRQLWTPNRPLRNGECVYVQSESANVSVSMSGYGEVRESILAPVRALATGPQDEFFDLENALARGLLWEESTRLVRASVDGPFGAWDGEMGWHSLIQTTSAARPILSRRYNRFTESEFRNGASDAPIRGGSVSATTMPRPDGGAMSGLLIEHNAVGSGTYAYKSDGAIINATMTLSAVIEIAGGPPVFSGPTGGIDFSIAVGNTHVASGVAVPLGGDLYRVYRTGVPTSVTNSGVHKSAGHSTRPFKISQMQLVVGDKPGPYQWTRAGNDYDHDASKFPLHWEGNGARFLATQNVVEFPSGESGETWGCSGFISHQGITQSAFSQQYQSGVSGAAFFPVAGANPSIGWRMYAPPNSLYAQIPGTDGVSGSFAVTERVLYAGVPAILANDSVRGSSEQLSGTSTRAIGKQVFVGAINNSASARLAAGSKISGAGFLGRRLDDTANTQLLAWLHSIRAEARS